jgi:phage FluMu gp28-like protein
MASSKKSRPAVKLTEYQKRWIEDKSRFKIALKARQTGYSFGVALEVALDCVEKKATWVLLSRGERQSKELMEKVAMHARAIGVACEELETTFRIDDRDIKQLEVRFPNGSKVVGLPANPDTARGFSGNVVLDEFAFHADSRKIWQALFPTITRGYRIRVISTPQGKSNKFYQLWTDNSGQWSKHRVDIYEAKAQGMNVNIDELRAGCESEDDWLQEFCCEFIDEAGALLTYELITPCESDDTTVLLPEDFKPQGDLTLGMDIGRRRDLTVMWILERLGDVYWTRAVHVLEKTPFRIQKEHLYAYLSLPRMRRGCLDSTGLGTQLAEEAIEAFKSRVEAVDFTEPVKQELAITQLRTFQDRAVRIPADRIIREDLHSVQKHTTAAGNIRYLAERTADGHADRFWALALALHAAISVPAGRVKITGGRVVGKSLAADINW